MSNTETQIMLMTYIMGPIAILFLGVLIIAVIQYYASKSLSKDILNSYDDDPIDGTDTNKKPSTDKETSRSFIGSEYPRVNFKDDLDEKKKREKEIENTRMMVIAGIVTHDDLFDTEAKVFNTEPNTMLGVQYRADTDSLIPEGVKGSHNSYEAPASSHTSWSSDTHHSSHSNDWSSSSDNSSYSSSSSYDSGYSSYDSGSSSSSDSSSW